MKRVLSLIGCVIGLVWASLAWADPVVSGISGTVSVDSSITINGTGFGTKSSAAPWTWDNFEDGTVGQTLSTSPKGAGYWTRYDVTATSQPTYQSCGHGGTQCAQLTTAASGESFQNFGRTGLLSDEMYWSCWFKWELVSGTASADSIMKMIRLNTEGTMYSTTPSVYVTLAPDSTPGAGGTYGDSPNGAGDVFPESQMGALDGAVWHHLEVYWRMSIPGGTSNGEFRVYYDGVEKLPGHWNNVVTRASGITRQIDSFLLPLMHSVASGKIFRHSADDIYVDRTRSRVVICPGATWAARGACNVQIPSAWSATSITATVNGPGTLVGQYLYVVDSAGLVNSTGFLVASASGGPAPPFSPALNLRVAEVQHE